MYVVSSLRVSFSVSFSAVAMWFLLSYLWLNDNWSVCEKMFGVP